MSPQQSGAALQETGVSIDQINKSFYDALNSLLQGDLSRMEQLWSHADDVTLLGPFGGRQKGWTEVYAELDRQCKMNLGGQITPQDIQVIEQGDLAIISNWERGYLSSFEDASVTLYQRAVNIFRKENGSWKLFFHQTDASSQLQDINRSEGSYGQEACDD